MNRKSWFVAVALGSLLFTGCHPKRGAMKEQYSPAAVSVSAVDSMLRAATDWRSLEVPVRLAVSSPASMEISGRLKMVRGETLSLSLRMIGFEVGKVLVTPDSLYISVAPQKIYVAESLSGVSRHVTISNLQDLLTGVPFVAGHDGASGSDFRISSEGVNSVLTPRAHTRGADYAWTFSGDAEWAVATVGSASLRADYELMAPLSAGRPEDATFTLEASGHTLRASIAMKWGSASFSATPPAPWTTPKGHRRVALADILKALGK